MSVYGRVTTVRNNTLSTPNEIILQHKTIYADMCFMSQDVTKVKEIQCMCHQQEGKSESISSRNLVPTYFRVNYLLDGAMK